eukprot:SAG22_NODE_144_length_17700_cov_21.959207_16_plen_306_part_00
MQQVPQPLGQPRLPQPVAAADRGPGLSLRSGARLVIFATFWAIFAPDIQTVGMPKDFDVPMAVVTLGCFLLFLFEMLMNFVVARDYGGNPGIHKFTMFFVIDVLGTASIVPEFLILFDVVSQPLGPAALARAGRAAKIGARLGRLVRMFRMDSGDEPTVGADGKVVGADKIAARVVLLVMTLIILIPNFTYAPEPAHTRLSLDLFKASRVTARDATDTITEEELRTFMDWYNTCDYTRCPRTEELVAFTLLEIGISVDLQAENPEKYELSTGAPSSSPSRTCTSKPRTRPRRRRSWSRRTAWRSC